jgi:hypothetical protein
MVGLQIAMLRRVLPLLSPALWGSVRTTPPSHTSEIAPKWASGSIWFGKSSQESAGLSFCVLVTISPRRAKLGALPRGMRSADTPPAGPRRWRPAGGPVTGAQLGIHMLTMWDLDPTHMVSDNIAGYRIRARAVEYGVTCSSARASVAN